MFTIRLKLDESEIEALRRSAEQDLRYLPEQIRYIVREGLMRRGLLPAAAGSPALTTARPAPDPS